MKTNLSSDKSNSFYNVKSIIKEKMQVLDDFGICSKHDETMRQKLEDAIKNNSSKNPREVLDYYCRPMIYSKINSFD